MKKLLLIMLITVGISLISQAGLAQKAYVMNPTKITLRKGPGVGEKIIAMLRQDEPVEVVLGSKEGWSHVRLLGPEQQGKEGWVVSAFLITRVPWKIQAGLLKEENTLLKEKLNKIEKEWKELSTEREELSGKLEKNGTVLDTVRKRYEALKKEASGFLKLKEKYETTKTKMEVAQATTEKLTKENVVLKSSQRNTWFLTGAAVLLVGLIFGLIMGRQQKKRKSSYY
ncbi:MAG: TIGR04211 family SH3 domain-containing protein [Desulfobacteraceae bacterium]|nr:TIGR04211 family SH3 domain-containing protein [Desulfobacteraceae bacterium]